MLSYLEKYKEKRAMKEKIHLKRLETKIEEARYECFKEIELRGGLYENLGEKQERDLMDFVFSLEKTISLNYRFVGQLKDRVRSFYDQLLRLDDSDLPAIHSFVKSYERKKAKQALQSA